MWTTLLALAGALAMILACGYALYRGDIAARWCGALIAVAWIGSYLLQDRQNNYDPQYAVAGLDAALCLAFFILTFRYRRPWLVLASASQLLTTATHVAFVIDPRIAAWGFMTAYYVWSYVTLGALVWGTRAASRETTTFGNTRET